MRKVLVTGATGYVGGRLLATLEAAGYELRCLVRDPHRMRQRVASETEVVQGDVFHAESLEAALRGVDAAYYLVHSMGQSGDGAFEERDRSAASNFAQAAARSKVKRIIYLGGLGRGPDLSRHLRSRQEVGRILASSGVQTLELRASIIIGSGSLSFEMIRDLVEKLPVMVTPRWVSVPAQPIGISDVIRYLEACLTLESDESRIFEIGCPDRVSYGDLMKRYARLRGLRRSMIRVPVLTPRLSSLWLGMVTPLYARIGRRLIGSIRHPTVVECDSAQKAFAIRPRGCSQAIAEALRNEDQELAQTRWSDSLSSSGSSPRWGGERFGRRLVDSRTRWVDAAPEEAFESIRRIGGENGWYYADWLWRLRGGLDLLLGGVGLRRGRRHPRELRAGDVLDCWRVERFEPGRLLLLAAEMKLPGRAWLQFEVTPSQGGAEIRQTALFDPLGLWGLAYWYAIFPLHVLIFRGMLDRLVRASQSLSSSASQPLRQANG